MKSDDKIIQQIRSVQDVRRRSSSENGQPLIRTESNRCKNTEFLYSLGLDSVILPGSTHPILKNGFKELSEAEQLVVPSAYGPDMIQNFARVDLMYKIIDESFKRFAPNKDAKYGYIRNMVFPIKMFQRHFESTPSVRQGLRNFWAEVSGHYGGFWNFKLGEDAEESTRIGISDAHYSDVPDVSEPKNQTQQVDSGQLIEGTALKNLDIDSNTLFTFPVFGKNSIVKSFDVNLDLSAEAATIARYGTFANPDRGPAISTNPMKK